MLPNKVAVPTRAVLLAVTVVAASAWATPSWAFSDEFSDSTLDARWSWTDSLQDCWYSLSEAPGNLRIHVPSGNHDLYTYSNLNAPRVTQPVSGDFSAETKVICAPAYDAQGAGLLVWQDSDNYLRLDRLLHYQTRQVVDLSGEYAGSWYYFAESTYVDSTTYLRLERTEDTFIARYSLDGISWLLLGSISFPLLDPVRVGLFVLDQWQDNPFEADFDYFRDGDLPAQEGDAGPPLRNPPVLLTVSPNPVSREARIVYDFTSAYRATEGSGSLRIYDSLGRLVAAPFQHFAACGTQTVRWDLTSADGGKVSPGVYFLRLAADGTKTSDVQKLVVIE